MTVARIEQLIRDDNDRLAWEAVGYVDEDRDPHVALSAWFDEQGDELIDAEYVAVCSDGRRTGQIRPCISATHPWSGLRRQRQSDVEQFHDRMRFGATP